MPLTGKTAVVVGGGGAIGGAIAQQLAAKGARVAVADLTLESARRAADGIAEAEAFAVDVTRYAAVEAMMAEVAARFGRIDILVNAAGGSARGQNALFENQSMEVVDRILDINLRGPLHTMKAVIPYLKTQNGGKIVNIASIVGIGGKKRLADYSAAKGGLIAFTKSLALELGQYNINVNCVSPGIVRRPEEKDDLAALAQRTTCLNRACTQADIARVAVFLALPDADFVTGQNYVVDGGRSLGLKGDS